MSDIKEKNKGGRPPTYETVEEMQEIIDNYFEMCDGVLLKDKKGEIMFDKWGQPIYLNQKPYTVTGLALALGFTSRQTLLNYQGKPEFMDTITQAKLKIEDYAVQRLFDRDGVQGAKFTLINNFINVS